MILHSHLTRHTQKSPVVSRAGKMENQESNPENVHPFQAGGLLAEIAMLSSYVTATYYMLYYKLPQDEQEEWELKRRKQYAETMQEYHQRKFLTLDPSALKQIDDDLVEIVKRLEELKSRRKAQELDKEA